MEEKISETEISLDEKEEESEEQKEDLPSLTLYYYPQCLPENEENYIVEFFHDTTESYYERGKYGLCWNFHVTKTPLYMLKVLKLLLFYLPMLVTLFFVNLFAYKIPMHRKWVRLKCVLNLILDALFDSNSYFLCEHLLKLSCLT